MRTAGRGVASITSGVLLFAWCAGVIVSGCSNSSDRPQTPPGIPTNVAAIPGDSRVTLTWDGGLGATSHNVYFAASPGVTADPPNLLVQGAQSPYVHAPATNGTPYYYVVTGVNAVGESEKSLEVFTTPFAIPTGVVATAGTSAATVTWNPVPGATCYNLYWSSTPGVTKATGTLLSNVTSPYIHSGLANGTPYHYVVTALSVCTGGVESSESTEASAVPVAAPTGLTVTGGTSEVTVSWSAVAGATSYNLYWSTTPGVTKTTGALVQGVPIPFVHGGRTNGTAYHYVVTAANSVGGGAESAESAEAFAVPLAAPTGVTAAGRTSEVTVSWSAVGGATSYDVYWSTNPGVTKATGTRLPNVTSPYVHPGLPDGTTHYYVVTAENVAGGGAQSAESAEALAQPVAVPTGLVATGGPSAVRIDWNPAAGAATYTLYWSTTPGVTSQTGNPIPGVTSPHLHTGPVFGVTYYYVITGSNSIGGGAVSDDSAQVSGVLLGGGLDPTFGGVGWIVHDNAAGGVDHDEAEAITVDASGRILAAGYSRNPLDGDMVIWRYTDDGNLDTSFNGQGWVVHGDAAGGGGDDTGRGIALDGAGKILVAGYSDNGTDRDMALWRYNDDGSLDTAFGGQGWVVHGNAGGGGGNDYGFGIVLDGAGRILISGFSADLADHDMVIWRYLGDGSLDATFAGQGWVNHDDAAGAGVDDRGYAIALDGAGRIVVAGTSRGVAVGFDLAIWRYNGDGTLDTSFNGQGWVSQNGAAGGDWHDIALGVAVDASDRIIATGYSDNGFDQDMVIWRYDASGSLDPSFDGQGWVVHDNAAGGSGHDNGTAITLDGMGRIVVAGHSENGLDRDLVIWRYNIDGSLDNAFNGRGWVTHDGAAGGNLPHDDPASITLDSSGRILIGGGGYNGLHYDMVIWRFK